MEVTYASSRLQKELNEEKKLNAAFGTNAGNVKKRHSQVTAADNAGQLFKLPGSWHVLSGGEQIASHVSPNHRFIIIQAMNPVPRKDDGSVDWNKVTSVKVTAANEDYHKK